MLTSSHYVRSRPKRRPVQRQPAPFVLDTELRPLSSLEIMPLTLATRAPELTISTRVLLTPCPALHTTALSAHHVLCSIPPPPSFLVSSHLSRLTAPRTPRSRSPHASRHPRPSAGFPHLPTLPPSSARTCPTTTSSVLMRRSVTQHPCVRRGPKPGPMHRRTRRPRRGSVPSQRSAQLPASDPKPAAPAPHALSYCRRRPSGGRCCRRSWRGPRGRAGLGHSPPPIDHSESLPKKSWSKMMSPRTPMPPRAALLPAPVLARHAAVRRPHRPLPHCGREREARPRPSLQGPSSLADRWAAFLSVFAGQRRWKPTKPTRGCRSPCLHEDPPTRMLVLRGPLVMA